MRQMTMATKLLARNGWRTSHAVRLVLALVAVFAVTWRAWTEMAQIVLHFDYARPSVLVLPVVVWLIWFSVRHCTSLERNRMLVMLFLIVTSVFFWALFEQAGSSLTLFTDRNVALGETITAGMFQSLNPLFIILLAPVFAWAWVSLERSGLEPSTPAKFGLGILQVGLGFAVLVYGASLAGPDGKVWMGWLAIMYLLHTTGELCLSPVGLSMITKLSVQRVAGMMMGVWFLSSSFAAYAAGVIAGLTAVDTSAGSDAADPLATLAIYSTVFERLAIVAVVLGAAVLLVAPFLNRLIHPRPESAAPAIGEESAS